MPAENSIGEWWLWLVFCAFVLAAIALDLGILHRRARVMQMREALAWSIVWAAAALVFAGWVYVEYGARTATEFVTGWLIEKALSIDNVFVFAVIFGALHVPRALQHRVLLWGVIGALVLRAAMILAGAALLAEFAWIMYVFGALLVVTGLKLAFRHETGPSGWLTRIQKIVPSTPEFEGEKFWIKKNGRWLATPLFVALLLVELSDIVFAVDSIPAIFAITRDPFVVFTSNVFAILGLRALFFLLAGVIDRFAYLRYGLAAVLVFVGGKMLIREFWHVPPALSLVVIALMLAGSIALSLWATRPSASGTARYPVQS